MNDRQDGEIDRAWWPPGADEQLVRECDCDWCNKLIAKLEQERAAEQGDAPATEGGDLSLHAFTE